MPKTPRKKTSPRPPRSAPDVARKKASARKTRGKSTTSARKKTRPLATVVADALDDMKGQEITMLDVRHLTDVTDTMVVVSGRSDRHVRALAGPVSYTHLTLPTNSRV